MAPTKKIVWEGAEALREHLVPIGDLRPHPNNPHVGNVPEIAKSLARFGQVRPVLYTQGGKTKTIVAGHHVTKAAKSLGWTHVAAIPGEFENRTESLTYLLADNELAKTGRTVHEKQATIMDMIAEKGSLDGTGLTVDDLADYQTLRQHETEMVHEAELKRHERNYRDHPEDQVEHLSASLKEHGFYRNVVIANEGTVLAGHGILAAARKVGLKKIPVTRLPYGPDDPEALKVIAGDNEMNRLAELDDRQLTEMLKEVKESGDVQMLLGTGYDAQTLANLVMVSRPASEIKDHNHAAEWVGLPEWEPKEPRFRIVFSFDTEADRDQLAEQLNVKPHYVREAATKVWSVWWPQRPRTDLKSLKFQPGEEDAEPDDSDLLLEGQEALDLAASREADARAEPPDLDSPAAQGDDYDDEIPF